MSIQFWEPASNVLITNQTAFPLNVGFDRVAPLQHTNSLQPGESWVTYPPPYFPIPESRWAKRILSLPVSLLHVTILSLSSTKWINRAYLTAETKIDIRFDHEHNRFRPSAARHLWLSFVLRWLGISALTTSFALLTTQICCRPSKFLHSEFFLYLQWSIGIFCILGLVFFVSKLLQALDKLDPNHTQSTVLRLAVPLHTFLPTHPHPNPLFPPTPILASAHTLGIPITAGTGPHVTTRAQKHLSVRWIHGRFALWDVDRDSEILDTARLGGV